MSADGKGTVSHAGTALLRELAAETGLVKGGPRHWPILFIAADACAGGRCWGSRCGGITGEAERQGVGRLGHNRDRRSR